MNPTQDAEAARNALEKRQRIRQVHEQVKEQLRQKVRDSEAQQKVHGGESLGQADLQSGGNANRPK